MTKKSSLAIYGDSFADAAWIENNYLAWPELLQDHYNITSYAEAGSSLWWSYEKFLKTYQNYDRCIFVVTVPGRIYIESEDAHLNLNPNTWPVWHGINIGKLYYRYFYSDAREFAFHNFLVNDILSKDNVLVVPAFKESLPTYTGWSLCHLADTELLHYGLVHAGTNEYRKCHMSKENNIVVYNKILNALLLNEKILHLEENDFVAPSDPMITYWK